MRQVVIIGKQDRAQEFGEAVQRWLDNEVTAESVNIFGLRVSVVLLPVTQGEGPDAGLPVDDRPRAVANLRKWIPAELVEKAEVEGRDWSEA